MDLTRKAKRIRTCGPDAAHIWQWWKRGKRGRKVRLPGMRLLEKRLPEERLLGKTDATETRRLEGQNLGHPQARGPSGPIGVANRTIRAAFKTHRVRRNSDNTRQPLSYLSEVLVSSVHHGIGHI